MLREMITERKTVIVAHNLEFGGAATAARRLAKAFGASNYSVDTLLIRRNGKNKGVPRKAFRIQASMFSRIDLVLCKLLNTKSQHWMSTGLIGVVSARKISRCNSKFVNLHWIGHATISLRQVSKIKGIILITAHDEWWLNSFNHYTEESDASNRNFLKRHLENHIKSKKRTILEKPNVGIVCLSHEMKYKFINMYPFLGTRLTVIPNPVDQSVFCRKATSPSESSRPKAGYFGGFSDTRKGFDLLFEALEKCSADFELIATGFKGESRIGRNNQVNVKGIPTIESEEELNQIYNSLDLTIVPSRKEALPQVATESLSAGTPVIAFDVGGLRDVLFPSRTGETVPSFDTTKLAQTIDAWIQKPRKTLINPELFAQENFSQDIVVRKYWTFANSLGK